MSLPYAFKNDNGDVILPVGDGPYFTGPMDGAYSTGYSYIVFCNAQGTPVTPTGGTFRFLATPVNGQWHVSDQGGPQDADTVVAAPATLTMTGGNATYTIEEFAGPVVNAALVLDGIQGATHVMAWHARTHQ